MAGRSFRNAIKIGQPFARAICYTASDLSRIWANNLCVRSEIVVVVVLTVVVSLLTLCVPECRFESGKPLWFLFTI